MSGERWHIVNGEGRYLAVLGLSSRMHIYDWAGFETAEAFRTMLEARDFIRWLGVSGARPIDHHPHPPIPPDADTSRPETPEERAARVAAEEAVRLIHRTRWGIK